MTLCGWFRISHNAHVHWAVSASIALSSGLSLQKFQHSFAPIVKEGRRVPATAQRHWSQLCKTAIAGQCGRIADATVTTAIAPGPTNTTAIVVRTQAARRRAAARTRSRSSVNHSMWAVADDDAAHSGTHVAGCSAALRTSSADTEPFEGGTVRVKKRRNRSSVTTATSCGSPL